MQVRKSYLIGGVLVAVAFGTLLLNGLKNMSSYYYEIGELNSSQLTVSEFKVRAATIGDREVTVIGRVTDSPIAHDEGAQLTRLSITDGRQDLTISYTGNTPGALRAGIEAAFRGRQSPGGTFGATWLTTSPKEVKVRGMVADAPITWDVNSRQTRFTITGYYTVSALREWQTSIGDREVRVIGNVVNRPVTWDPGKTQTTFAVTDGRQELSVAYQNAIPDSIRAGAEVVLVGKSRSDGTLEMTGLTTRAEQELVVVYNGSVPDIFDVGVEVVIDGKKGADGIFRASLLTTKCASKYTPPSTQRVQ
ncbi:MAG: cytochrome c maturation protein CcmE [Chloroflexota bacterium]